MDEPPYVNLSLSSAGPSYTNPRNSVWHVLMKIEINKGEVQKQIECTHAVGSTDGKHITKKHKETYQIWEWILQLQGFLFC